MVSKWIDGCLALFPRAEWEELAAKAAALPVTRRGCPRRSSASSSERRSRSSSIARVGCSCQPSCGSSRGLETRAPWSSAHAIDLELWSPPRGRRTAPDGPARRCSPSTSRDWASSEPHEPPGSGWTVGAVASNGSEVGHLPVMVEEVIVALSPHPGSFQIDATVGGGGHAARILEAASPGGRLLGLDADPRAIARTRERLADVRRPRDAAAGELRGHRRRSRERPGSSRSTASSSTSA